MGSRAGVVREKIDLEKIELRSGPGRAETGSVDVERAAGLIETETPTGILEALAEQIGEQSRAPQPGTEIGIVLLAAAQLPNSAHDVRRLQRIVMFQPVLENPLQLPGQSHDGVSGHARASFGGG